MRLMSSIPCFAFLLRTSSAMRAPAMISPSRSISRSSSSSTSPFMGQGFHQRRSFARNSAVRMMPEGPEVRTLVDQLQAGVGRRLVDIQFLSGRYVRHGKPESFEAFANTMVPTFQPHSNIPEAIDIIQEWNAKGKFIYMTLDNGNNPPAADDDYQRSIWVTLGMSGQFVTEKVHKQNPRFARWYIELLDVDSMDSRKVYYHDQRNFGTLKFCLSRQELEKKLMSLGLDILDPAITEEDFLAVVDRQKPELNVCKFLMDQSKLSGVGNYILAECLYRSNIDPFATLSELSELLQRRLFQEIRSVAQESYQAQGLTRTNGGTFRNVQGGRGQFEFQLQCYGRDVCVKGNPVIKLTEGPHKRTIWYTAEQLFRPLADRVNLNPEAAKPEMNVLEGDSGGQHFDTPGNVENMISGLTDVGWKKALAGAIHSSYFSSLAAFIEQERESGTIIYPRQEDVFSALNLCPLEKVKVVIVGQDPYHGPGQGHGLAFSVRRGVKPPPSLKNIVREAMNDVGIEEPTHGNLEHWAQQGVLLLNTVLSVQQGQANSHSKKGWEEFTDAVIDELNTNCEGLVFLLWGSPAAKKAKNVDESKHTVIRTSHPSPLGATKTSSPFLGSRCFSRANAALEKRNKTPIDWNVV